MGRPSLTKAVNDIGRITGKGGPAILALIQNALKSDPESKYALVKSGMDVTMFDQLDKLNIPWLSFTKTPSRTYPNGAVAGNLIGFVSGEGQAQAGLELSRERVPRRRRTARRRRSSAPTVWRSRAARSSRSRRRTAASWSPRSTATCSGSPSRSSPRSCRRSARSSASSPWPRSRPASSAPWPSTRPSIRTTSTGRRRPTGARCRSRPRTSRARRSRRSPHPPLIDNGKATPDVAGARAVPVRLRPRSRPARLGLPRHRAAHADRRPHADRRTPACRSSAARWTTRSATTT